MQLKIWKDGSPHRPLLLMIPGFMSQAPISSVMKSWSDPIIQYACEHSFSAGGLYWKSGSVLNNGLSIFMKKTIQDGLLDIWKSALHEADIIAHSLNSLVSQVDRPVILVSHSLGARICLKFLESHATQRVQSVVALAPALSEREVDLNKVLMQVDRTVHLGFSKSDLVLQCLYPLGNNPSLSKSLFSSVLKRSSKSFRLLNSLIDQHLDITPMGCEGARHFKHPQFHAHEYTHSHIQYAHHLYDILTSIEPTL